MTIETGKELLPAEVYLLMLKQSALLQEMANEDLTPKDVDREYVVSFMITDEKSSFLLRPNLAAAFPSMPTLQYSSLVGSYASFGDSEGFANINGNFQALSLELGAMIHCPSSHGLQAPFITLNPSSLKEDGTKALLREILQRTAKGDSQ